MLKDAQTKTVDTTFENRKTEPVYTAPQVFPVGLAKDLIQGPMINEYWDCVGSGKTLTRPNC